MCEKWQWHKSGLRNLIGGGGSTFCLITMFLGPVHYINQNHFIYKVSVFWEFYCTNEYSREDGPSQPSPPPLTRLFLWPWPYWTNSINILNIDLVSIDWNYAISCLVEICMNLVFLSKKWYFAVNLSLSQIPYCLESMLERREVLMINIVGFFFLFSDAWLILI